MAFDLWPYYEELLFPRHLGQSAQMHCVSFVGCRQQFVPQTSLRVLAVSILDLLLDKCVWRDSVCLLFRPEGSLNTVSGTHMRDAGRSDSAFPAELGQWATRKM